MFHQLAPNPEAAKPVFCEVKFEFRFAGAIMNTFGIKRQKENEMKTKILYSFTPFLSHLSSLYKLYVLRVLSLVSGG